jgi:hypothetical protein
VIGNCIRISFSDTFSAFYLMAAASRVIRGLHLEDYGFAVAARPRSTGASTAEWAIGDAAS